MINKKSLTYYGPLTPDDKLVALKLINAEHNAERNRARNAERNLSIKALISKAFSGYKVSVKGSRGTSSGWVELNIGYAPRDSDESRKLKAHIIQLIAAAKIEIGTYGYGDPGSDYGYGNMIFVHFDSLRDDPMNDFNNVSSQYHY